MALDSRNKRASAIWPRLPFRRDWPLADGTVDAEDRAATVFDYGGIQAGPTPPISGASDYRPTWVPRRR